MDVATAISERRTAHTYTDRIVGAEVLKEGLRLALLAPNHRLTYPWRFAIVGKKTRAVLADIAFKHQIEKAQAKGQSPDPQAIAAKVRRKISDPGGLIVFAQKRSDDLSQSREDYAAVACAVQNFCLAMTAEGLSSKWSTGAITRLPETYAALAFDKAEVEIVGFVWVGEAALQPPERKRPALEEVTTLLD